MSLTGVVDRYAACRKGYLKLECQIWGESLKKAHKVSAMRQVLLYPGEDGFWVAECPSLKGCVSQGKTKEEALANIREAIEGYVEALEEDNLPVPPEKFEALTVVV
jgi:predicted RNase H-like HicB family nuclease